MTSMRWLCAAVIAAFSIGCGTPESNPGPTGGVVGVSPTRLDPGHGRPLPPGGGPMCAAIGASGTAVSTIAIDGGATLAVDAHDNVFYTAGGGKGIVKQTAAGERVFAFGYGTGLAIDAAGNAYVAGSFTQPIDLGHGTLTPEGNIDVFVAKLSPRGTLLFAEQLGLCGDGVESIAVASDGRIAVSGTSMGTAIFDASGKLLEQLSFAGHLAFAPNGNLYIAGSFTGSLALDGSHVLAAGNATDVDAFVAQVDVHGDLVSAIHLGDTALPYNGAIRVTDPMPQTIDAIAVSAHGEVALLGSYEGEMSLFGQTVATPIDIPSGVVLGSFAAKLDATGQVVFTERLVGHHDYSPAGAIAIADDGRIAVSTNSPREAQQPNAHPDLLLYAADGTGLPSFELPPDGVYGWGLGIAFDACGNLEWADTAHPSVLVPMQPTLRLIAR